MKYLSTIAPWFLAGMFFVMWLTTRYFLEQSREREGEWHEMVSGSVATADECFTNLNMLYKSFYELAKEAERLSDDGIRRGAVE